MRDDALIRSRTIAFEESRVGRDPVDAITPRMLSEQYLQRYRERGDVGDALRAQASARESLRRQPAHNVPALESLAAAQLTLHQFREALATIRAARSQSPGDRSLALSEASLDLEVGDLDGARQLVQRFASSAAGDGDPVSARLAELTGDMPRARALLARASSRADAIYGLPNERRAWFHTRLGELAFEAGDLAAATSEEETALARFPDDVQALTDRARFAAATGDWKTARTAAERASALMPSPANLGLQADAQAQTGDAAAAATSRDEVQAVGRVGNAQHLVDRLIALYDADHGVQRHAAYAIARRETALRDDVYAEDTLAWTAASDNRWDVASRATARATAWGTADSSILYHAGVIAEHDGNRTQAITDYRRALAINPQFAAFAADDARRRLAALQPG